MLWFEYLIVDVEQSIGDHIARLELDVEMHHQSKQNPQPEVHHQFEHNSQPPQPQVPILAPNIGSSKPLIAS